MTRWYSLPPRILQTLAWLPTRLLFNFSLHFKVYGQENLKNLKQAIFAVNHASELDPIILTAALSPLGRFAPMFYIGAAVSEFQNPKFGWRRYIYKDWFFKSWGSYSIIPGLKDYEKSLAPHIALLNDGQSICIFPEGRITRDGNLQEGKGGVSYLLHKTGVPVVPVAISENFKLSPKEFLNRKRKMTVTFGIPIEKSIFEGKENISIENYKEIAQTIMNNLKNLIK